MYIFSPQASDLQIEFCTPDQLKKKPAVSDLVFGRHFTDHMLEIYWDDKAGWGQPRITPFHDLRLHPAAKVLHYAVEVSLIVFHGVKKNIYLLLHPLLTLREFTASYEGIFSDLTL